MTQKLMAVVMDPIQTIKPPKDTTLALMLAAQARGWQLHYLEMSDLWLRDGVAGGRSQPLQVFDDNAHWFELGPPEDGPLHRFPVLLMRKDPPFDMEYVNATYILERAEAGGTLVVNKPQSLRDCNEKAYIAWFPDCVAPTLISRDMARIRAFHAEQQDIVVKPLDGMGGSGVFRIAADGLNLGAVLETLTLHGHRTVMAQRYLPEIRDGDKRILMVDGRPAGHTLARIPAAGETRGNLAAGGRGEVRALTARDRWIADRVGPALRAKGLLFVGLDVIGENLTEINVTSPTCVREIERDTGEQIADAVIAAVERRLQQATSGEERRV